MRFPVFLLSLLLLLSTLQHVAFAQAVIAPPIRPRPQGDVATMAKELHLSDDQVTQLIEKLAEMRTTVNNWTAAHKDQQDKLRSALDAAQQAKDKVAAQRIQLQLRVLTDELAGIQSKGQQELLAILTPEQQLAWSANRLLQQGDFAAVQKLVPLTPDQLMRLKEQAKTFAVAQSKWKDANGDKVQQLQQQIRDAQDALGALMADQDKLAADNRTALYALLTPEQQLALLTAQTQQDMLARLKKAQLTDVQIDAAKSLCATAAKKIITIPATVNKARTEATVKLYQTICDEVLTDAQRGVLAKVK